LKQGKAARGVLRQYTGSAGKITSCQICVFAAHVSQHGHALINRRLYLPRGWTDEEIRPDIGFSIKPRSVIDRGITGRGPGMKQALSLNQPRALPKTWRHSIGGAYRWAMTEKGQIYMTGIVWNWRIQALVNSIVVFMVYGHAVF
jgi:hypothetical protein